MRFTSVGYFFALKYGYTCNELECHYGLNGDTLSQMIDAHDPKRLTRNRQKYYAGLMRALNDCRLHHLACSVGEDAINLDHRTTAHDIAQAMLAVALAHISIAPDSELGIK